MKQHLCNTISGVAVFLSLFCTASCKLHHKEGSDQPVYIYPLVTPSGLSKESARGLIEKFTGDKNPENIVQSDDSILYYVSRNDLNTTFEQDLKTGNFTFNK